MRGTATTLPKDAEIELVGWIDELRNEAVPVPGIVVRMRAMEIDAVRSVILSLRTMVQLVKQQTWPQNDK
jgi:hypothetical protein